ncbi:MAG: HAMP domain-containing sensor histidine kinase [Muribaculaceae bacterium]|nr:HAMP domain-containing sensor histidine kinase [Muribaculaceae bacterium]
MQDADIFNQLSFTNGKLNCELMSSVFKSLPIGVGIFSLEGEWQYYNEMLRQIVIECNCNRLCNIVESEEIPQDFRDNLKQNKPCETVLYFNANGDTIPDWVPQCVVIKMRLKPLFNKDNELTNYVIISENISEAESNRRRLIAAKELQQKHIVELNAKTKQLEELSNQTQLILQSINTGLIYLKPDYTVAWRNHLSMYGENAEQMYVVGTHCYEHFGRTKPCDICPVVNAHIDNKRQFRTFFDPGGLVLDVDVNPVFDKNNNVDGYLLRLDDVTLRENLIKNINHERDKAQHSERMKMSFLENMSHEIRTPLNAILGFTELLNGEDANEISQEERTEYLSVVASNAEILSTLVNDILDISRLESGRYQLSITKAKIGELSHIVAESINHRVPTGVALNVDVPTEIAEIVMTSDIQRIQQLLINFLTNACKYTLKGMISLSVRTEHALGGTIVNFAVTDTGVGIPPEKAKTIFKRFEKLDEYKQGTGLGLNICQTIADLLNGRVYLDNTYKGGSRFVFEVPLDYVEKPIPQIPEASTTNT